MTLIRWVVVGMFLSLGNATWAQSGEPLQTIASLEVPRYMGRWFEIAKFPNSFQKKCVSDTTADYRTLPDGRLQVVNQCRMENGATDQAVGLARQLGGPESPRLQVRFAPAWLSLLPFVWGDYWVIDLDDAYQLAAVSEPKREYLWILSRTPVVDETRYTALLARLRAQGLDLAKLEKSMHTAP